MPLFNSELPSFNKKPVSPNTSISVSAPLRTFTGQSGEQPCVLGSCRAVVWRTRGGGAQNGPPPALECLVQLVQAKLPTLVPFPLPRFMLALSVRLQGLATDSRERRQQNRQGRQVRGRTVPQRLF